MANGVLNLALLAYISFFASIWLKNVQSCTLVVLFVLEILTWVDLS